MQVVVIYYRFHDIPREEILPEVMCHVNDWCRYGRGIDNVIIKDMCDEIRDDDNI